MTLYMIGLGLSDEKDISVRGLEIVKNCDFIYLENYTSVLQCKVEKLEKFYDKKIILANRAGVEQSDDIIERAANGNVALLVVGDPMCATTHIDLYIRAKKKDIKVEVIHNSSIVSAVGILGLEVYKYGKITSIPFHNENVKTPIEVYEMNKKMGLHTLFLLDLEPESGKFLSIKDAAEYLISNGIDGKINAIGCARIGSADRKIIVDSLQDLGKDDFGKEPYCIVIPGNLHFMEEDALKMFQ